jgi:hypothetical protein
LLAVLSATPVWAARPLDTEDPGTVPPGNVEIELSLDYLEIERSRLGGTKAVLSLGVVTNLEVRVEAAALVLGPERHDIEGGVGDTLLGVKYRLLDETDARPAVLTAVNLRLPTGDASRGFGAPGTDVTVLAVVGKSFGPVALIGNAGYSFVTEDRNRDTWTLGASVEWAVGRKWSVAAEVVSVVNAHASEHGAIARTGVLWRAHPRAIFDAAIGVGLTRTSPDVVATVGVTLRF